MIAISSNDFIINQNKCFDMAINEKILNCTIICNKI